MSAIDQIQVYNTNLTKEQVSEAFSRALNDYADTDIDSMLAEKVDKVAGKGLSSNDYTAADLATVEKVRTDIFGQGTELEDGDDLNDIKDAGSYYAVVSTAPNIHNSPVTGAFRLEAVALTSRSVLQKLYPVDFSGTVYTRSYNVSVWGDWYAFTGTQV